MTDTYVVVVKHNVVVAIERQPDPLPGPILKTPLEAGTQVAENNRANGCIDGRYHFDDTQRARIFASLCLEFTKALVEKRLAAIDALPVGTVDYRADDERDGHGTARGAG